MKKKDGRNDKLLMEYALQGIDNQIFAARYQFYQLNREELQAHSMYSDQQKLSTANFRTDSKL